MNNYNLSSNKARGLLLICLCLVLSQLAYAQTRTITGTITDCSTGTPIPGANIIATGTTSGAITDINGMFTLTIPQNQTTIEVTLAGYPAQTIDVSSGSTFDSCMGTSITPVKDRPSGTYDFYTARVNDNFGFADVRMQIEDQIGVYLDNLELLGALGQRPGVVTIPVVVHVIEHETSNAGYVDYQSIQNQITYLNTIFRKHNAADISTLPASIQSMAADTKIEFVLAQRSDGCADDFESNELGVTRTKTSESPLAIDLNATSAYDRYPMKFSSAYGRDGYPADDYLNIWVCELDGDACGYASLPGESINEDGIVIDYRCFQGLQAISPFDQGKVLAHLVAQWLNVYNIFGPEGSGCSDSDEIDDTPNQDNANFGCPNTETSCGNSGDFYMNHMDFTNDSCRKFFTIGQAQRMEATLFTYRAALLNSQASIPVASTAAPDLWMKDSPEDIGNEPNLESPHLWRSPDIWVRREQTPSANVIPVHENPIAGGDLNYVYVRVQNRGCVGVQQGTLSLHWAKASSGLAYPEPWDGSVTTPVVLGGLIGSMPVSVIAGESTVYEFEWDSIPNPQDYASFGADKAHFCLLAVLETPSDNKPTLPSQPNHSVSVGWFVKENNNVAWKNISIAEPGTVSNSSQMLVGNFTNEEMNGRIVFREAGEEDSPFENGTLVLDMGRLSEIWNTGGRIADGVEPLGGTRFKILSRNASIGNLKLPPNSHFPINIEFVPNDNLKNYAMFGLEVEQHTTGFEGPIGGQRIYFKTDPNFKVPTKNWVRIKTRTKEDLYAAHFPSKNIGYAGGTKGCLIKTVDGGKTWKPRRKGIPKNATIYAIHFLNDQNGFALGSNGSVFRTRNGGIVWNRISITKNHIRDITFLNGIDGFMVSDGALFKSKNGGNSWININHKLPRGILPSELQSAELYFMNSRTGFILLQGKILKTTDRGENWRTIEVPGNALYDMDFVNSKRGYLCGIGTGVLLSSDQGNHWKKTSFPSGIGPQAMLFTDSQRGYTAGRAGRILQTLDGGKTWTKNVSNTKRDLHKLIYLRSVNRMIAFGKKGVIITNTNP